MSVAEILDRATAIALGLVVYGLILYGSLTFWVAIVHWAARQCLPLWSCR